MGDKRPAFEPSAEMRAATVNMFQLFVSLQQAGFSDAQALYLVGATVSRAPDLPKDEL